MKYYNKAIEKWNSISMPLGSLGVLQEDIARIASVRKHIDVSLSQRTLIVVCADNGVVAKGVSQSGPDVTEAVAAALGKGESTANIMANTCRCRVLPVDCGMEADTPEGVLARKIRRGTADISEGPAMTEEELYRALQLGRELAKERKEDGDDIIILGEMGIGNTTTSAAVCCVLFDMPAAELAGRGAGLSDEALERKIEVIERAIKVNAPDRNNTEDVLRKVGGLDIAVMCGICLGAEECGLPVIMDGVITNVAALCAVRMRESVRNVLIASHVSKEKAAALVLDELGVSPAISAGLRLGEGTGGLLFLPMLDQALALYESGHTFDVLGIDAYVEQ